jgi:hypothetical protein
MDTWNSPGVPNVIPAIILCGLGVFCTICAGFLGWKMVLDEEDKSKRIKRVA